MPVRILMIALGGGLGALARYALGRAWGGDHLAIPVTTLTINLLGSLLLGALVVAVTEVWHPHPNLRPFLGTGVLGGFTTFSTFAVQAQQLPAAQLWLYLALSLAGGVICAAGGMSLLRKLKPRRGPAVALIDPDLP